MESKGIYYQLEVVLEFHRRAAQDRRGFSKQEKEFMLQVADIITWAIIHDADSFNNFYRFLTVCPPGAESRDEASNRHSMRNFYPFQKVNHMQVVKAKAFQPPQNGSLGVLGALPGHLIQKIFEEHVDIASLMKLRASSRALRELVDGMPKYSTIVRQASHSGQDMRTIRLASGFTCHDLWIAFSAKECAHCGQFGGFIYLPTCSRVCYRCSMEATACRPLDLVAVKQCYSITRYELARHGVKVIGPISGGIKNLLLQDELDANCSVDMAAAAKVAAKVYSLDSVDPFQ
jgi:hypothetical protein